MTNMAVGPALRSGREKYCGTVYLGYMSGAARWDWRVEAALRMPG
jgi:hypothetical protein